MTEREKFEKWATEPPREWDVWLNSPDHNWPDQYKAYHVQCAWEAWQAAKPSFNADSENCVKG